MLFGRRLVLQTIYIDVLIILNIYVNYFLLRMTAGITRSPLRNLRCIAASALGSLFSLSILLPPVGSFFTGALRIVSAAVIVAAAFGYVSPRRMLLNTAAFFVSNFVLAGCIYAVYSWFGADFMHFNNGCFCIDFSLIVLIVTTAALYAAVYLARLIFGSSAADSGCYSVIVRYRERIVNMEGIADTGNTLVDVFTGSPVIVCDRSRFEDFLSAGGKLPRGFRYLPCRTVSADGVIPVFRPDEVLILNRLSGERKPVDALVGLGECSGSAVFDPRLLKF